MPETMRAVRFHGKGDVRVDEVPKPSPKEGEVLIEIEWCGVCGTDLHEYQHGPLVVPRQENPHPITGEHLPIVLGHEFTGRVVQTVPSADLKLGDKVIVDPRINCKSCYSCRADFDQLCYQWGFMGLSGYGGGFSEFVAVPHKMCHRLNDNVDLDVAALIEPLCVGRHALTASGITDFSKLSVLVVGGGPIGVSVLLNLRAIGVKTTFVSEPTKARLKYVETLADKVFSPLEVDVGEECRKATDGVGFDVAIDCAGIPAGLHSALDALAPKGVYVNVAGWTKPLPVPPGIAMMKELVLKFSFAYHESDFKAVVEDFAAGKFAGVETMITSRISLEDVNTKGFGELIHNKDHHVKILATPKAGLLAQVTQDDPL